VVCVELITLVKELLVLTHKEHYYYLLGSSIKKVLLDSVIVGKLNHDLRVKKNLKLLEWVNV
jgi:hypothetical protein